MRKRHRQLDIGITLLLAFVLFACANARQTTIRTTLATATVVAEALPVVSEARQRALVAESTTKEEATAKTLAFQTKVEHAKTTLNALVDMALIAAVLEDDHSFNTMVRVAAMAWAAAKEIGVKLP